MHLRNQCQESRVESQSHHVDFVDVILEPQAAHLKSDSFLLFRLVLKLCLGYRPGFALGPGYPTS